ncbi:MAG: O-linked N-acetylglucosamine transferase, SPINDLY family protein [Chloroflexaceae bacterium]|nr:O-linked N-acetylglucosamine transferase, SPINDLY family protein [Chloroflexaceae bacterium]
MSETTWHPLVHQALLQGNYLELTRFYEQRIETEPDIFSHYWHLGLAYLLEQLEAEAQSTWLFALMQAAPEDSARLTNELVSILTAEAERQQALPNAKLAWLIRGHIRELVPGNINNLLHLIQLDIQLDIFKPEKLKEWHAIAAFEESSLQSLDTTLLWVTFKQILQFPTLDSLAFAKVCLPIVADSCEGFGSQVSSLAHEISATKRQVSFVIELLEESLKLQPRNIYLLHCLATMYQNCDRYNDGAAHARKAFELSTTLPLRALSNYQLLTTRMQLSDWLEIEGLVERHRKFLQELLVGQSSITIEPYAMRNLLALTSPLLYLQDNPRETRFFANQLGKLFEQGVRNSFPIQPEFSTSLRSQNKLRIGYLSQTLRQHSVGWLSRWLFKHHDRNAFDLSLYLVSQKNDDITKTWFQANCDRSYDLPLDPLKIATQIHRDEIDILVDLDSITSNSICRTMALKPAPIQVTWLGYDASGIPGIDYFMGDAYVLPENAQEYYHEKIWRLPNTYVAVDGFEIGIPSLNRETLKIPAEAVVYFNQQNARKRNPRIIRLQMQILATVADSYLLVKGRGDEENTQKLFEQIAAEQGVNPDRLRFLGRDPHEAIHRANLQIADVVLDTYPYNGATTTLEVLWLGIPLVTRVGQQFSARNSYAFMTNAGLTEGIAWTDEEYVEWGIRFGQDPALRDRVTLKLRESRHTSPLWNAQQFTRDMEAAYQQMWAKYLANQ